MFKDSLKKEKRFKEIQFHSGKYTITSCEFSSNKYSYHVAMSNVISKDAIIGNRTSYEIQIFR